MFVPHRNTMANCFIWSTIHKKEHSAAVISQVPKISPGPKQPMPTGPSSQPMSCVRSIRARPSFLTKRSSLIAVSVSDQPIRGLSSPSYSGIHMSATTTVPGPNGGASYALPSRNPNQLRLSRPDAKNAVRQDKSTGGRNVKRNNERSALTSDYQLASGGGRSYPVSGVGSGENASEGLFCLLKKKR